MIHIFTSARYKVNKKELASYAQEVLSSYNISASNSINIAFVGKRKMKQIASKYKDENVALPVLSFPYMNNEKVDGERIIGELVICYPQAILLAAERSKTVDALMKQLITHGIQNMFRSKK